MFSFTTSPPLPSGKAQRSRQAAARPSDSRQSHHGQLRDEEIAEQSRQCVCVCVQSHTIDVWTNARNEVKLAQRRHWLPAAHPDKYATRTLSIGLVGGVAQTSQRPHLLLEVWGAAKDGKGGLGGFCPECQRLAHGTTLPPRGGGEGGRASVAPSAGAGEAELGGEAGDLEKELAGARAELAASQPWAWQAKAQLVEAATARLGLGGAGLSVGTPARLRVRIRSAQDRLDGLRGRAVGLAAERLVALSRLEKLDSDLAEVEDWQVALEQLHREALARGPPPVAMSLCQSDGA